MNKTTILTAHQSAYLPWLGLFHKIALCDIYVDLDNVQFEKNSFINRNKIKSANGPIWLTVPVRLKGHTKKVINQIEIDNSKNWQKDHWKSIYLNYKRSRYFAQYADFFEDVYRREWSFFADLSQYMLKWFLAQLGIKIKYFKGSALNLKSRKSDLVLEICKKLSGSLYVSGALGKDYINGKDFEKSGIKVYFQNYTHPVYSQLYGSFLSNISIIDLMFNVGPKSLDVIMQGNINKKDLTNEK